MTFREDFLKDFEDSFLLSQKLQVTDILSVETDTAR